MFNKEKYIQRRKNLQKEIKKGVIVFLGNNESSMNFSSNAYRFRQDSNFLYFFGIDLPNFAAVIDLESGKEILFANDFTIDDIIWMGKQPLVKELADKCGIKYTDTFNSLFKYCKDTLKLKRKIHFLPPYRFRHKLLLEKLLKQNEQYVSTHSSIELISAIVKLRENKDIEEIAEIEKACDIGYNMHVAAMKMAHPNVSEQEITGLIEGIAIKEGYMPSFPIILSQDGFILHNHSHHNILQKGKFMLVDAGAETQMHYASDFTRTVPVGGVFSQMQKDFYNIVLESNEHAFSLMKPGVTFFSIHKAASKVIIEGLKHMGIMKGNVDDALANNAHTLFFPHGLGHMMGLDVHDMEGLGEDYVGYDDSIKRDTSFGTGYLRLGKKLQEGFVITNEPGIYFIPTLIDIWRNEKKHENFINYHKIDQFKEIGGIRLEDDILITKNSSRLLGAKRIPITTKEIEETMRRQ